MYQVPSVLHGGSVDKLSAGHRRAPGKKAGDWIVVPAQMTLCTGCKIYEDICLQKAITVSVSA